ncbi:MAG: Cthe_2314 family HEPN domain-containing protein [Olivibacter sp.]|nr:Cthe_2314 family HEPN domain-containing protein [Olivibacter sp. UJ_SKK_5.1]
MAKKGYTIKATDFKYPTREELKEIRKESPSIGNFNFPYVFEISSLLNKNPIEEVVRNSHLHWWDTCLTNRLGNLSQAYENTAVNFNRGIPSEPIDYSKDEVVNWIQFNFYGETYCYFFHSVKETLAQVLNIYFGCGKDEKDVTLFKVKKFLMRNEAYQETTTLIENFSKETTTISEIRNSFVHRYPSNFPDYRPSLRTERNGKVYGSGSKKEIKSSDLMNIIKKSYEDLEIFVNSLRPKLN